MPQIDHLPELTAEDRSAIVAPLDTFSGECGHPWDPRSFALALRDDEGQIVGGLIGEMLWGWLRIGILAVAPELRGVGWGRRLVAEAERLAVAAGCRRAWVDTFSFQAPGFYQRLGYQVFGELADFPAGERRLFFWKVLAGPGGLIRSESLS